MHNCYYLGLAKCMKSINPEGVVLSGGHNTGQIAIHQSIHEIVLTSFIISYPQYLLSVVTPSWNLFFKTNTFQLHSPFLLCSYIFFYYVVPPVLNHLSSSFWIPSYFYSTFVLFDEFQVKFYLFDLFWILSQLPI